jgi:hypothetical protein
MRQLRVVGRLIVSVAICSSGAAAEETFQKLTGAQIRGRIAGMEVSDEVHWRDFYDRTGRVTSSSMGHKRTGKWRIEKDQLCARVRARDAELLRSAGMGEKGETAT